MDHRKEERAGEESGDKSLPLWFGELPEPHCLCVQTPQREQCINHSCPLRLCSPSYILIQREREWAQLWSWCFNIAVGSFLSEVYVFNLLSRVCLCVHGYCTRAGVKCNLWVLFLHLWHGLLWVWCQLHPNPPLQGDFHQRAYGKDWEESYEWSLLLSSYHSNTSGRVPLSAEMCALYMCEPAQVCMCLRVNVSCIYMQTHVSLCMCVHAIWMYI